MTAWKFEPEDFHDVIGYMHAADVAERANAKLDEMRREAETAGWWFEPEDFNELSRIIQKYPGDGRIAREAATSAANDWLQRKFRDALEMRIRMKPPDGPMRRAKVIWLDQVEKT